MDNQTINRTILLKKGKQDKKRTAGIQLPFNIQLLRIENNSNQRFISS